MITACVVFSEESPAQFLYHSSSTSTAFLKLKWSEFTRNLLQLCCNYALKINGSMRSSISCNFFRLTIYISNAVKTIKYFVCQIQVSDGRNFNLSSHRIVSYRKSNARRPRAKNLSRNWRGTMAKISSII